MNLFDVIEELVEDRGLNRDVLSDVICKGMLAAYERKYPDIELQVKYDKKTGEIAILVHKQVVPLSSEVEDEFAQISLKKARFLSQDAQIGESVWLPFEGKIGRIEILQARQVIASSIRQIEAALVHKQFKPKEGHIVVGVIHKCERGGMIVKIDENLAFLPQSATIPGDKCVVGFSIRALLREVLLEPKNDNQLILSRTSDQFLQQLFELEIPELFEKLIEIKKIARIPGYKSKIIVFSNDVNIDPVGTCVGVGGSRIKPILKELSGEKIDIIPWSDKVEVLIKNALRPAEINSVEVVDGVAKVSLDDDQRSVAIGKMGQNIKLTAHLVGMDIQLVSSGSTVSDMMNAVHGNSDSDSNRDSDGGDSDNDSSFSK